MILRGLMISRLKDIVDNEKGYVLVVSLLMLTVVTVIGIAATRTSDTELQIASNERQHLTDFYSAEGGVIYMLEDYTPWLTTAFLTAGETAASYGPVDIRDRPRSGQDTVWSILKCTGILLP